MNKMWEDPTQYYSTERSDNVFDLIEYQDRAREIYSPKRLFELWEEVCKKYDRGFIGKYALEEMKAVIWPKLHTLSSSQFFGH
ncbi:MAG: hypothetical protein JSS86_10280 [Cyanobacteria bacterium SZAS LIN-2]|nr:hypothetical protein [Cyanobacteria bacterium SZAS LIN-3]MBS1996690.1 hypothetical protein [Cyanobacteria bacterium SZAS LIN-2]MBS2005997.1 hypothetical protein [Cyanobacteria bacterium SZAS TMP-1]